MLTTEVYDIETLNNLFAYTGYVVEEDKWYTFVIHDERNEADELYKHLMRKGYLQVGFNNIDFDYLVLHYFILTYKSFENSSAFCIANSLYQRAQQIINSEEKEFIPDTKKYIWQIDLFKIWHYNNKSRRTSLFDLEFNMNLDVQEMPFDHTHNCSKEEIDTVLAYNKKDVEATVKFYYTTLGKTDYSVYKGKNKLGLRKSISRRWGIPCYNWSDTKIGEQLMLELYCWENGYDKKNVKEWKTPRSSIPLRNCIPKWCNIKTKEFNDLLNAIKRTTVMGDNIEFSKSVIYHDMQFDFGLGGCHGSIKSGVYKADDEYCIIDLDVNSLYPSIAKSLNLYPEHLGESFNRIYTQFIDERIAEKHKPKDQQNKAIVEGLKLILNSVYGKSNAPESFLYDPLYTYKTTIAGQCFISMWIEKLVKACDSLVFLQANTDGITIKVKRKYIDKIRKVCNELTELTGLTFEESSYKQMIIKDCNNYIAEYDDSTKENEHLKLKGCFEIDKEYHKDMSMKIVPIALKEYFINGVPFEETLKNDNNIFDFCIRLKTTQASTAYYNYLEGNKVTSQELQRTTRYYASNTGGTLKVIYKNSGQVTALDRSYTFKLFNTYYESDDYDINYKYYLSQIYRIYDTIIDKQLKLF